MNKFKAIGYLVIVIVVYVFIKNSTYSPLKGKIKDSYSKQYDIIKYQIDTLETVKNSIIYRPGKDIYHDTIIYVEVPVKVDTMAILKDYFAKNIYRDTLMLKDSLGYVTVHDTVTQNMITSRKYVYEIKQNTIRETVVLTEKPKSNIFLGVGVGLDKVNLISTLDASMIYKSKRDKVSRLAIGMDSYGTPFINASVYWKIK